MTCREVDVTDLTLDIEAKAQMLGTRDWQLMEVAEGSPTSTASVSPRLRCSSPPTPSLTLTSAM